MFAEDDWQSPPTVKARIKPPGGARDFRGGHVAQAGTSTSSSQNSHSPKVLSPSSYSRPDCSPLSRNQTRGSESPSGTGVQNRQTISHSKSSPSQLFQSLSPSDQSESCTEYSGHANRASPMMASFDSSYGTDESNSTSKCLEVAKLIGADEGLFDQLLDDLDNISNLESAQQRRRATQIFSSWLFSPSSQRSTSSVLRPNRGTLHRVQDEHPTRRYTADVSDFDVRSYEEENEGLMWGENTGMATVFRRDTKARHSVGVGERVKRTETLRRSSLDVSGAPPMKNSKSDQSSNNEDGPDSGYHTGNSSVLSAACKKAAVRPSSAAAATGRTSSATVVTRTIGTAANNNKMPGAAITTYSGSPAAARTAAATFAATSSSSKVASTSESARRQSIDVLHRRINDFNRDSPNSHGLLIEKPNTDGTYKGAIRIHMNLIRPINMCTSARPPSLCHTGTLSDEEFSHEHVEITSFYIPKHSTVIHINSETKTQEVIRTLLSKFRITDNPRKFAMYEKKQKLDKTDSLRRMGENETPLQMLLDWAERGVDYLDARKFVLQENDTGEINWDEFSLPELDNFLTVLNREEEEYIDQIKNKFRARRVHVMQMLREQRPPVFV